MHQFEKLNLAQEKLDKKGKQRGEENKCRFTWAKTFVLVSVLSKQVNDGKQTLMAVSIPTLNNIPLH